MLVSTYLQREEDETMKQSEAELVPSQAKPNSAKPNWAMTTHAWPNKTANQPDSHSPPRVLPQLGMPRGIHTLRHPRRIRRFLRRGHGPVSALARDLPVRQRVALHQPDRHAAQAVSVLHVAGEALPDHVGVPLAVGVAVVEDGAAEGEGIAVEGGVFRRGGRRLEGGGGRRSGSGPLGGCHLRLPLLPSLRTAGVVGIQFFRVFAVQCHFLLLGCQVATIIVATAVNGALHDAVDGGFDQFLEGSRRRGHAG
mmetsp:Transcript_24901/g.49589  ORF Transcript_24901/g.49589 Transcript_24901/m.49589 type:complete len:253 (-) Transcript_24901:1-759(-)